MSVCTTACFFSHGTLFNGYGTLLRKIKFRVTSVLNSPKKIHFDYYGTRRFPCIHLRTYLVLKKTDLKSGTDVF